VENGTDLEEGWLAALEREDGLFPGLNAADWASRS
jgi:1,4-alpha-glucan branching enzyme